MVEPSGVPVAEAETVTVKTELSTQSFIDQFNHTAAPDILNKVSLDTSIPLDENVHISLGEKVDEIMRRRGLDLAKTIKDGGYERLVFLDQSARPIRGLARAAWQEELGLTQEPFPQSLYLNIGKEKHYRGLHELPDSLEEFKSNWPAEFVDQLENVLNKLSALEAEKVLIIDDVRGTGVSAELTSRILHWYCPNIKTDKFWLIDDQADKNALVPIYDRHVPWKKMQTDPVQSLITDDVQEDNLTTFVSKPQEPEFQKKALEYRRRLYHYFKGLYKKQETAPDSSIA